MLTNAGNLSSVGPICIELVLLTLDLGLIASRRCEFQDSFI